MFFFISLYAQLNGWHELSSCILIIQPNFLDALRVLGLWSKCVSEVHYK